MNTYRIKKAFLLSISLIVSITAQAQQPNTGGAKKKKATGRVAYVIYTTDSKFFNKPVLIQIAEDKVERLQLSKRSASKPIKIPKEGVIRFVKATPQKEDQPYTPYAVATIPEGVNKALIVLTALKKTKNDICLLAKVVPLRKFKKGDWLFINLTKQKIAAKMGKVKMKMKPNSLAYFDASKFSKSTNVVTSYYYYHNKQKKWKLLSASTCVVCPTRREICIFSQKKSGRIDYHGVSFVESPPIESNKDKSKSH